MYPASHYAYQEKQMMGKSDQNIALDFLTNTKNGVKDVNHPWDHLTWYIGMTIKEFGKGLALYCKLNWWMSQKINQKVTHITENHRT